MTTRILQNYSAFASRYDAKARRKNEQEMASIMVDAVTSMTSGLEVAAARIVAGSRVKQNSQRMWYEIKIALGMWSTTTQTSRTSC